MEYRAYRKLAIRLQCVGALVLGVAGAWMVMYWQPLGDGGRWSPLGGPLVGFPVGCLAGLYAGGKGLLKHKGLNLQGAFFAVLAMYAGMVAAMAAAIVIMLLGGRLMIGSVADWMSQTLVLAYIGLAGWIVTWYAAKVFNFFAELDD